MYSRTDLNQDDDNKQFLTESSYQAPKPSKTLGAWAKIIAARIFFPPILLWDGIKLMVNTLAGDAVGERALPATKDLQFSSEDNRDNFKSTIKRIRNSHIANNIPKLTVEEFVVVTHDNARLDTLQIKYDTDEEIILSEKQCIVNFVGNGMCYQQILVDMVVDARQLKCDVIGFDFRGVNQSTGKPRSKDDLVTDGIAQVQRLLDNGFDPENITLKGQSLGAGVATLVAEHFHSHGKKVNLFNGRSFSSLTNVVVGLIRTGREITIEKPTQEQLENITGHQETFGKKILGWLAQPFIKFGLAITNWEIDAESAYKNLPDSHKEYMVVRSSKKNRQWHGKKLKDDTVIPHYASLHSALKDERTEQKAKIDEAINCVDNIATYTLVRNNLMGASARLKDARRHLKARKMIADDKEKNAHNIAMDKLTSRYKKNNKIKDADHFFRSFFTRVHKHHEKVKASSNQVRTTHTL